MFCKNCGTEIKDGEKKCPSCGQPVDSANIGENVQNNSENKIVEKPKKKKKIWIIAVVIIALLVLFAAMGGESSSSDSSENNVVESSTTESDVTENTLSENSSVYDLYNLFADNDTVPFTINEKAKSFLNDHPDLFPASSESAITGSNLVDSSIDYRGINKNSDNYGDKLMYLPELYVNQIWETNIDDKTTLTELNVSDGNIQYYIFYLGSLPDIYEEDIVMAYGLPLGTSSFANTDGGDTLVVVLAGSCVSKLTY